MKTTIEIYNESTDTFDVIELPAIWAICDRCEGNCKHTNPSIDGNGLSGEILDDHEFMNDYFNGLYDIPCAPCKASGKVLVPDYDFLTEAQQEALQAQQEAEYAADMESAAERRMGA